eukprot:gnl/TRDRNA2_/TRDRNA2_169544_c0_seq1.p1 gnl/TRDRNA2_/TRDRNA2_169544_c0~~gnl/TRDRNA2_/TRDRNA2_169544_c0_seq1.p1  ORF type:complete len:153 (-),score=13.40 gnl/TRDRNA2_/TRDRNA2_169544_c0_seq1:64-522(-)
MYEYDRCALAASLAAILSTSLHTTYLVKAQELNVSNGIANLEASHCGRESVYKSFKRSLKVGPLSRTPLENTTIHKSRYSDRLGLGSTGAGATVIHRRRSGGQGHCNAYMDDIAWAGCCGLRLRRHASAPSTEGAASSERLFPKQLVCKGSS